MKRNWQNRLQNDIQMQKRKRGWEWFWTNKWQDLVTELNECRREKNLRKPQGLGSNYEEKDHGNDQDNDGRSSCHCFWKMINLFTLSAAQHVIRTSMHICTRSYWKMNIQFGRDQGQGTDLGIIYTEVLKVS